MYSSFLDADQHGARHNELVPSIRSSLSPLAFSKFHFFHLFNLYVVAESGFWLFHKTFRGPELLKDLCIVIGQTARVLIPWVLHHLLVAFLFA